MTRIILSILIAIIGLSPAHADGRKKLRYYAAPKIERDRHDRDQCLSRVRGVGQQWIGTEGAMDAAKKDWMERVRYDFGETYLDLSHAEDFEARCGRTSVGQIAGQVMYRCEVFARPCKAELSKVEGQK